MILIIGISGLLLADRHYKLALFGNTLSCLKTITATVMLLFIFDIIGVINGVFFTNYKYVVGIYIFTPNLPIEEILFLMLLSYFSLIVYLVLNRKFKNIEQV